MGDLMNIKVSLDSEYPADLEIVRAYLRLKYLRWDRWEKLGGDYEGLLERTGGSKPEEVITWGFGSGEGDGPHDCHEIHLVTYDNLPTGATTYEYGRFHKELIDLQKRFPSVNFCAWLDSD